MARSNVAKTRNCIRVIYLGDSWFWMEYVPHCFWMAVDDYVGASDFYSIIHSSKDQEFMDRCNNARRFKRTKFYCYLLWIDIVCQGFGLFNYGKV